ncbi:TetR/AcrR family transcriptional regulator [Melghirimyces algeriensis]|uniref:Transcriptional regulator, TetR family n=1 Tax=Melghirimyces algeriensis TaxID=910412 RepID=A0A521ABI0_9BACL|nr:TetR/AcrR family transcriptional regulator [Melghirimyces algeriensis]SMO32155.1 transcriptional regulator, TetR family [Melghirimyces algeriensis]
MPKQTFFNLPQNKRERIIAAAIDEFAEYHFLDASINRIIDHANISRGSFYQYFEDLEDLYQYIFQIVADKKQAYMDQHLMDQQTSNDIFQVLRKMYQLGLKFAEEHPAFAKIGNHLFKGDKQFKLRILGEWEEHSKQFFIGLLKKGQEEGTVRQDLDLEVASFLFYQLSLTLTDQYLMENDWFENINRYLEASNEMLNIFAQGIRAPK